MGLSTEHQREAGASLRPGSCDGAVIGGDFPLERRVNRWDFEVERRLRLFQRAGFDAINTLVEAVERGHGEPVVASGNVQNKMECGFSGLQRTGPCAIKRLRLACGA